MHKTIAFLKSNTEWDRRPTTKYHVLPETVERTLLDLNTDEEVILVRALLALRDETSIVAGPRLTASMKAERFRVGDLLGRLGVSETEGR